MNNYKYSDSSGKIKRIVPVPDTSTDETPEVSIIAPLYNEEDSVQPLYDAIHSVVVSLPYSYEVIFVNDGSSDGTFERCRALAEQDKHLRIIEFRKNYGQTPAMAAGIDNARGDILVTMDGDLQNDPTDIPMMIETLKQGYDIVVGWRHNRQDKLLKRKIPSMIANRLIGKVTGVSIKDNGCSLKVYRASLMQRVPFYSEMHRFIPALLSLSGARFAEVKVKHHARQFGESKYGLSRVYKVLLDLLTIKTILSLVDHPTTWFAKLAAVPFLISLLCACFIVYQLVVAEPIVIMSTTGLLFFTLGAFLVSLGFLCELIYQQGSLNVGELALLTAKIQTQNVSNLSEESNA